MLAYYMKEKAYAILEELKIPYEKFEHPPLFTCEDAKKHRPNCDFLDVKNLFVRNKNKSNLYLVVIPADKRADLQAIRELLQETKLCFAESELLAEKLKVTQGAVSILCVANLDNSDVTVLIDSQILEAKKVGFHPSINTETLVFATSAIPIILNHAKVNWKII